MRYRDRSPLNSDCSCGVGFFTYCDGCIKPRKLSLTLIQVPIPHRSAAAADSSRASSEGARRHSTRSVPACNPTIVYAYVVTELACSIVETKSAHVDLLW